MAELWVNECGNALDVELSAGVGEVEGRGRGCNDDLRLEGRGPLAGGPRSRVERQQPFSTRSGFPPHWNEGPHRPLTGRP